MNLFSEILWQEYHALWKYITETYVVIIPHFIFPMSVSFPDTQEIAVFLLYGITVVILNNRFASWKMPLFKGCRGTTATIRNSLLKFRNLPSFFFPINDSQRKLLAKLYPDPLDEVVQQNDGLFSVSSVWILCPGYCKIYPNHISSPEPNHKTYTSWTQIHYLRL